jgi:hypothetical protein
MVYMRHSIALLSCILLSIFLCTQSASQVTLDQPLSQGFYGLDSQTGPATYTFTLPETASYLFAGILVREGSVYMEVKNSSGHVYPVSGGSVVCPPCPSGQCSFQGKCPGEWTDEIASAYKCNQLIRTESGAGAGLGYGFYNNLVPPGAYISAGDKEYFLFDPSWGKSFTLSDTIKITWIDFSLSPCFKINFYEVDPNDNGPLIKTSTQNQAWTQFKRKDGYRYLGEVDATQCPNSYALTVMWPR